MIKCSRCKEDIVVEAEHEYCDYKDEPFIAKLDNRAYNAFRQASTLHPAPRGAKPPPTNRYLRMSKKVYHTKGVMRRTK